MEQV
ncbi:hypothetical protein D049_1452A, partial [Vibrio parahaemolyticus VPTS-2010]|jgi:hypothetical protein